MLVLALLAFANTIGNGYNMDDELVTKGHKFTSKGLSATQDIFTQPYYSDAMGYSYGYRPMVHFSFAVEHTFFGESAAVSHFFNVLLYAVTVLVFFRLLRKLSGPNGLSFAVLATLLFIFHPVHTEVVASIKNRDEILALLFGLLAGLAYFRAFDSKALPRLLLAAVLFIMALLSKKSIYPLSLVFPLASILVFKSCPKRIFSFAAALIIPGALIGAEMQTGRVLLMVAFPYAVLLLFWLMTLLLSGAGKKYTVQAGRLAVDYRFISAVSWGLLAFSCWRGQYGWAVAGTVLQLSLIYLRPGVGFPQTVIYLAVAGLWFREHDLLLAGVFLAGWHLFVHKDTPKTKWAWVWLALAVVAFLALEYENWGTYPSVAVVVLFMAVLGKKPVPGTIIGVVFALAAIVFEQNVGMFSAGILLTLAAHFLASKVKWQNRLYFPVIILVAGIIFSLFHMASMRPGDMPGETAHTQTETRPLPKAVKPAKKALLKEGRELELAENTLVLPHTKNETVGTGVIVLNEYLRLMLFPYQLSFYYGYAEINTSNLANPWVWVGIVVHLGMVLLAFWQMRKRPLLSLGIFWYLFSIGLFSNWVELVAGMVGERLAFTASAGFCIFLAAGVMWIKPAFNFKTAGLMEGLVGLVLVAFCLRTVTRNADWKDQLTLMGNDIAHLENSAQANNLYALNLMQNSFENKKLKPEQQYNMRKLAIKHFDRAVQIWPMFFNAAYDKGRAADVIGDLPTAIKGFEQAVGMGHTDFMDPNYQLGELYLRAGRYPDFLNNAKRTFAMSPSAQSYSMLARGFFITGRADSAKVYLRKGIAAFPDQVNLKRNMIEIFKAEGQTDSVNYYSGM